MRRGLILAGRAARIRRRLLGGAQTRNHAAGVDPVPRSDRDLGNDARRGRRHIQRCLLGLERDQRGLDGDRVTRLDQHVDDGNVLEIAQIGNLDVDAAVAAHGIASSNPGGSASSLPSAVVNRTASAPSITRWSYDSDSGSIRRGTKEPFSYTAR